MIHPIHAILADAAERIAASIPADMRIASLRIVPERATVEVQLSEPDFRRLAAGRTISAYGWDGAHCGIDCHLGPVGIFSGTDEHLNGAVQLDAEGRTIVLAQEVGRG